MSSGKPVDPRHEYLGDGVYVSYDGYHFWLRTGSHDAEHAIALEPAVLGALLRYRDRVDPSLEPR